MECKKIEKLLYGSFFDSINDSDHNIISIHLKNCDKCKAKFQSFVLLNDQINLQKYKMKHESPSVEEARRKLIERIQAFNDKKVIIRNLLNSFIDIFRFYSKPVLAGFALLIVGFWLGRVSKPNYNNESFDKLLSESTLSDNKIRIANLRFVNRDPVNEDIEIAFESVRPIKLKGNLNEERIQRILALSLIHENNPGIKIQTVNAISSTINSDAATIRQIKSALTTSAMYDNNPGVRREALRTLFDYPPDKEIIDALIYILTNDDNAGLRIMAINAIESINAQKNIIDDNVANVLKERIKNEQNQYIRVRAKSILEEYKLYEN